MSSPNKSHHSKVVKGSDADGERRRREEHSQKLRKEKKDDKLTKQRKVSGAVRAAATSAARCHPPRGRYVAGVTPFGRRITLSRSVPWIPFLPPSKFR